MKLIPGFVGPAYEAPSLSVNHQRCINMLLEVDKNQAKTPLALYGVPGLELLSVLGGGAVRDIVEVNGELYGAVGQSFGRINPDWSFTALGSFAGTGRVKLVSNGLQVLVVDGVSGFVWTIGSATWTQITDSGFVYGATQATYQDSYGIVGLPNTGQFGISGQYDFLAWAAIDFASAEGLPDNLSTVVSNHRLLHVFGTATLELWYNSGAAAFPFQRVDGAFYDVGCSAPYSACVADDSVFWLGNNPQGALAVYRMQGQTPQRISTVALENEIKGYARVDDAVGVGIDIRRHPIYLLTFPSADKTWCYDAHSGSWFEWLEWSGSEFHRFRLNCVAAVYGKLLVGDYRDGRLYSMDFDAFTNNGDPIRCVRTSPYVWDAGKRLFHSRLEVLMEAGIGLRVGEGADPLLSLRWSDDGRTWSNEITKPIGRLGEYDKRVIFNRLGAARNRVYEIAVDAPIKKVVLGATLEVSS
jgi:hypothetical protein